MRHIDDQFHGGTLPALSFINLPVLAPGTFFSQLNLLLVDLSFNKNPLVCVEQIHMLQQGTGVIIPNNDVICGKTSTISTKNSASEVTKDAFRSLKQLQQLSLKCNKIRSVDVAAFQGNPSMVMLDLSRNELIDLAPGTFLSQLNLLLVDLSFNKIVRTPFGAFGRRIATVLLQENPLVCVEQIHMLQQGTGVFIPNNEDVICGKTSTISTTKSIKDSASESPSIDQVEDSTLEEAEEESAFVQQKGTVPPKDSSDELADSVDPTNNGHQTGRMPNIRPIRVGPQQLQQTPAPSIVSSSSSTTRLASSPSNADRMKSTLDQNDKLMSIMSAKNAEELSHFSADENEINNKMITSAPNQLNEKIEKSSEEDSAEGERAAELDKQTATDTATTDSVASASLTTVDSRNNPAVIYPHPVPFLSSGPKLHTAHSINNDENGNPVLTLPPSIVMAAGGGEQILPRPNVDGEENAEKEAENDDKEHGHNSGNVSKTANDNGEGGQKLEQFELRPHVDNELERNSAEIVGEDGKFTEGKFEEESGINVGNSRQKSNGKPLPTAVIVICMTVGVVMLAVFVGMCVAKKRQIRCFLGDVLNAEHIKEALAEAVRKSVSDHRSVMMNVLIGKTNFREGSISV